MNDILIALLYDSCVHIANRFLRIAALNIVFLLFVGGAVESIGSSEVAAQGEEYLTWSAQQAQSIGKSMRSNDPDEGSGVIPLDWQAFLQPKNLKEGEKGAVAGANAPKLRDFKALGGVIQRDYNYDVFWLVFPLTNDKGELIFPDSVREAELVVRIYNKEGRIRWPVPLSIRRKS